MILPDVVQFIPSLLTADPLPKIQQNIPILEPRNSRTRKRNRKCMCYPTQPITTRYTYTRTRTQPTK